MKKKLVILSMGMLPVMVINAQQQDTTLVRTVVVENQYNPIVMDASKINVLPKVEEPTVPKTHIDYATSIRPVAAWNYQSMQPIVKDWKEDKACRGYLRAGYGNNGNVGARLGYLWDISKKDRLSIAASFGGWNGELSDWNEEDWKSRLYNTKVGLDYSHAFKKINLMLGGYYRSQVFNYMKPKDYMLMNNASEVYSKKQHQTIANAYFKVASSDLGMPIQFMGEIGMNYFKQKYPTDMKEGNETNFYVKGDIWKPFNAQGLGVAFDFNNYAYSMGKMENTTSLELNPYYKFENDDWRIRLGAHVDWWSGMDDEVKFSPDVNVEYVFSDSYVLYAKADGGMVNKDLVELTNLTPYWILNPPYQYIQPTYVTLDVAIGLKASPADGWWFNLTGGYQIRENDLSWRMKPGSSYANFLQGKANVFYGSAELKYDYKDWFDFSLGANYYHWDCDHVEGTNDYQQEWGLALKPELEVNAEVGFKPIQGLRAKVGYEYVKRSEGLYEPISNLYIGADYTLLKNLTVFANVNNLLNKEYVRPDAYPAQKLNFLAGLSLQF